MNTARRSSSKPICRSRAASSPRPSPPDDRAGYGIGDRRTGARRSLLGRRRRGRSHRRPHSPSRPLRDAASARARYRRSRPRGAIAGAETEDRPVRSREAGRQGQGQSCQRRRERNRPAETVASAEHEDRGARSREAGRQRQGKLRDRRRKRDRQVYPLAGTEAEELGDRSQEAGGQTQSGDRRRQLQRDRGRSSQAVAGAEIEDRRDRSQETGRKRQSAGRQRRRRWESGCKVGPASRPRAKKRPVITLLVAARSTSQLFGDRRLMSARPGKRPYARKLHDGRG